MSVCHDFLQNILPPRLTALNNLLGDKKYFSGDTVTYCDFNVYHHLDLSCLVVPSVFDDFPMIREWMKRIEALPGVKEYLEKRPVHQEIQKFLV